MKIKCSETKAPLVPDFETVFGKARQKSKKSVRVDLEKFTLEFFKIYFHEKSQVFPHLFMAFSKDAKKSTQLNANYIVLLQEILPLLSDQSIEWIKFDAFGELTTLEYDYIC